MSSTHHAFEANFDGLIGPSHHYAGHSFGNVASLTHQGMPSQPREAALQGLEKARALIRLGLRQGMLPPLRRPRLDVLHSLGFRGREEEMLEKAHAADPQLLSAVYSASNVWVANAATVSPSADTTDGRVHFTPANLSSKFHRSIEPLQTAANLQRIFAGEKFVHHPPLPPTLGDEGAANHGRFCDQHGAPGLELFVYGRALRADPLDPRRYPARQVREASEAVARLHGLREAVFLRQNPDAIDAGIFHNDVISVVNENVFFLHERAFTDAAGARDTIRRVWTGTRPIEFIEVKESEVSVDECVKSYLFNSQLVTLPSGKMALICPTESRDSTQVSSKLQQIVSEGGPIAEVHFFDLRQSMQNGGGPACLRLRVVLTESEWNAVLPGARLDEARIDALAGIVRQHYRDRLTLEDLRDPLFYRECQEAFDALEGFWQMPLS